MSGYPKSVSEKLRTRFSKQSESAVRMISAFNPQRKSYFNKLKRILSSCMAFSIPSADFTIERKS